MFSYFQGVAYFDRCTFREIGSFFNPDLAEEIARENALVEAVVWELFVSPEFRGLVIDAISRYASGNTEKIMGRAVAGYLVTKAVGPAGPVITLAAATGDLEEADRQIISAELLAGRIHDGVRDARRKGRLAREAYELIKSAIGGFDEESCEVC